MTDATSASDHDALPLDASEPILRGEIVEGPLAAAWSASPAPAHATSDQAVRLPEGLAEGVRELVRSGWAAKKHLDAASAARNGLLVVLQPSPQMKKGLADGTLKLATRRKDGSFLAQARDANTNAIVENLAFDKPGASQAATTAKAAAGGAAIAWQVMA